MATFAPAIRTAAEARAGAGVESGPVANRPLLIFGGLSGVVSTLAYFAAAAVVPWDHDLPVELSQWEIVLGFWAILAVAPFAIVMVYVLSRLIAWEREGALNQLGFVFGVVAFSILAVTQSFQNAVPIVLTNEMDAEGSGPEAWDRIYAGLNALDLGTDLAWDLFLGVYMLCVGAAMLRHSCLGLRWGLPALALVPPFFAFNIASTPDPPHVDLGPVVGAYFFALSVRLVWLGARRGAPSQTRRIPVAANKEGDHMIRNMGTLDRGLRVIVVAPLAVVAALLVGAGTVPGVILFVVAGIMLATGATGFCPTYVLLGIATDPRLHRVGHGWRAGHA